MEIVMTKKTKTPDQDSTKLKITSREQFGFDLKPKEVKKLAKKHD